MRQDEQQTRVAKENEFSRLRNTHAEAVSQLSADVQQLLPALEPGGRQATSICRRLVALQEDFEHQLGEARARLGAAEQAKQMVTEMRVNKLAEEVGYAHGGALGQMAGVVGEGAGSGVGLGGVAGVGEAMGGAGGVGGEWAGQLLAKALGRAPIPGSAEAALAQAMQWMVGGIEARAEARMAAALAEQQDEMEAKAAKVIADTIAKQATALEQLQEQVPC
jgi:hypothetical protein